MKELRKQALDSVIIFWTITNETYDKLREIRGCKKLENIQASRTDYVHIKRMAVSMGVEEKHYFHNHEATKRDLIETRKKVVNALKAVDGE